jgi:hypothetical protein
VVFNFTLHTIIYCPVILELVWRRRRWIGNYVEFCEYMRWPRVPNVILWQCFAVSMVSCVVVLNFSSLDMLR